MAEIIQLPDSIANQIAAGEVIQRPASAVKELLENAIDAQATSIKLIVTEAGKNLIQVIDNGKGMGEVDARLCFERHATSKIKNIDDLFRIKTMGFRGEALASIAAVAQVEMKTRQHGAELGNYIEIENSSVIQQEPCACEYGTSISMKNLFFNVPARRNFLKNNAVELRHIVDEFIRVTMAFPEIFFSLISNGQEIFHLEAGGLKQRIIQLLGNTYNAKMVNVKEETDYMNIYGFVGKPETAKKTRGDQYLFVNSRYIKSAYLNHAINSAFQNLIPKDSFPGYVLFIDLDPAQIDINVHPTKQEIKFEDEKITYAFVQAAVKHALAQFSISPTLDFTLNADIQQLDAVSKPFTEQNKESVSETNIYKTFTQKHQAHVIDVTEKRELKHWKDFFGEGNSFSNQLKQHSSEVSNTTLSFETPFPKKHVSIELLSNNLFLQVLNTYILVATTQGFILVHQQLAHERILYEKYSLAAHSNKATIQKSLFPVTMEFSSGDSALLVELLPDLLQMGYQIEQNEINQFIILGTPADIPQGNEKHSIELLIEQFKHFSNEISFGKREKLVRCLARQQSIKAGVSLTQKEMSGLIDDLFMCNSANLTPTGIPIYIEFKEEYLDSLFGR